jgi:hypothetical protein
MTKTAQPTQSPSPTKLSRVSAWIAFAIAILIAFQGGFLLVLGFDEANFAEATGIEWEQFVSNVPAAAEYLDQGFSDRIFAVTALGLGLQTALLIYLAIRRSQEVSTTLLFILPAVLIGWSLILMPADQNSIAIPSLVIGILMALAVTLARRALDPSTT